MVSVFLREQGRYTQDHLIKAFKCSGEKTIYILKKLRRYDVLKIVKATNIQKDLTELLEEDIEIVDLEEGENGHFYVFTFVGVIVIGDRVLKCFPKYLLNAVAPKQELKQVLTVLEKYNSKEQLIRMYSDTTEGKAFNLLAVMLFLLQDYYEYGFYTNSQEIVETNGSGEILWDKTINETFSLISCNRPYYPELLTLKRINDDFDYFKRLHECVLTKCSKEMQEADLLDLFNFAGVDASDEEIDCFGEVEYILGRIDKELNIQFNTRKQLLLKTLYAYIARSSTLSDMDCLSMFGTNSFNLVWEQVCVEVMDNQLQKPLSALKLPVPLSTEYEKDQLLISLIEKPSWWGIKSDTTLFNKKAKDTLIPDLISIVEDNGEFQFIIFDAKYYNMQLEQDKPLRGQLGIESITKQYLYQLAYKKFVREHNISKVINCFLMPTDGDEVIEKGYVSMQMFQELDLSSIQVRMVPAKLMYEYYINNRKMDLKFLKLDTK